MLRKNTESISGDGYIRVEWRPFPRISLKINCYKTPKFPPIGKMHLEIPDKQAINFDVYITSMSTDRKADRRCLKILGDLTQPETIFRETPIDCSELRFHLINFESNFDESIHEIYESGHVLWKGRLRLENEKFKIIVDLLPNADELIKKMGKSGGYSITHTGLATLRSGYMKYKEADDLLDALYYYFAFLSCRWCGPVLSVGISDDKLVWKKWDVVTNEWYANVKDQNRTERSVPISGFRDKVRLTPWQSQWMWSKNAANSSLNQVFKGFMEKWNDVSWKDSLKIAIYFYVEANQAAGGTEGAIVLAQSALELLTSLHADRYLKKKPCENRFKDIPADERIRWLLEDLDIPVEIDSEIHPDLTELRTHLQEALPRNEPYKDGPRAITLLRNAIIHPGKSKVNRLCETDDKVKLELLDLSIWYLEMVLLRLFGYTGQYANRLWRFRENRTGDDFIQQVPWDNPFSCSNCDDCPMPLPRKWKTS